jgi:hypothetical protein
MQMSNWKVESEAYGHHELSSEGATKPVRKEGNESNRVLEKHNI